MSKTAIVYFSRKGQNYWNGSIRNNEGSGLGGSERDIKKLCPGAEVVPGLSIRGCAVNDAFREITDWARRII
jgi:hypothetical protein